MDWREGKPRGTRLSLDRPCTRCGCSYPEVEFSFTKRGYRCSQCRECNNKTKLEHYFRKRPKILEYQRAYRQSNKEFLRESQRKYYNTHKELVAERHRIKYQANKEYHYIHTKTYRINNPAIARAQRHRRLAKKRQAEGHWTAEEWLELKKFYNHTCLRCGKREPEIKLTVDHVVPLSKGGSNFIQNLQPLCQGCNSRKHAKAIDYRPTTARMVAA